MENKKVFMGNLSFEITKEEVETLLSEYGTIVELKLNRKKGYAIVEMSDESEALKAIENLEGVKHRDREIRISFEMKAGKAKLQTIRKYNKRSAEILREKKDDKRSRKEKHRDFKKALYEKKINKINSDSPDSLEENSKSNFKKDFSEFEDETKDKKPAKRNVSKFYNPKREKSGDENKVWNKKIEKEWKGKK